MEAPHNIESLRVSGKIHFVPLKLGDQTGVRTRDLRVSKQEALTTAPGPPPLLLTDCRKWLDGGRGKLCGR